MEKIDNGGCYEKFMKNSEEILNKIKEIPDLDREITKQVVRQDIEEAKHSEGYKKMLESSVGVDIDFNDEGILNKLVESYMQAPPYMGYCNNYWSAKKEILKEKYNIDWYTPTEENPDVIYD